MFKIDVTTNLKPADLNKRFHDDGECLKRTYSTAAAAKDAFDHEYKGDITVTFRVVPSDE